MSETACVPVTGGAPYDVVVGRGIAGRVVDLVRPAGVEASSEPTRVALVHPAGLAEPASRVAAHLGSAGLAVTLVTVPDGESAKAAAVVERCWHELGLAGLTRSDVVVGVGGGATTDLAGFVAATFLRGIALVLVPTTLLAMVDAAVGGKTGINTAEGKNLVGSFHEPRGVLCDLDLLSGLPEREMRSGLAEVVKCGLIADPVVLELVRAEPQGALDPTTPVLAELVERAVRVKALIVSADLRESTSTGFAIGREALNYGHTLGHAVERLEDFSMRHGEAVAIGMVYAAEVGYRLQTVDDELLAAHRSVLSMLGLPTSCRPGRWDELLELMRRDKKARGRRLRMVLLHGLARPAIAEIDDESVLRDAYRAVSE